MNKYTIVVNADKLKNIIPVPAEFMNKEVELSISLPGHGKIDPRKYRGTGKSTRQEIDRELDKMRKEWK